MKFYPHIRQIQPFHMKYLTISEQIDLIRHKEDTKKELRQLLNLYLSEDMSMLLTHHIIEQFNVDKK